MGGKRGTGRPKERLGEQSSLLVSRGFLAAWLAFAGAAIVWGQMLLALFLLFLFLVCLCSRLWGMGALKQVFAKIEAPSTRLFPGDVVTLSYTLDNRKFLPLIWLELVQRLPKNGCLVPEDPQEISRIALPEEEAEPVRKAYEEETLRRRESGDATPVPVPVMTFPAFCKRFVFLLWYQRTEWSCRWKAVRRGVYRAQHLLLRAGDGFGLSQTEREEPAGGAVFAVYPCLTPVRPDPLLRNLWEAQSGARGFLEDCTIIRSERAYQNTDSWKRIDWRMAARQQELQVRLCETILPKSIHFILQAAAFPKTELEPILSLLASLLIRLEETGVRCGLSLPAAGGRPPVDLLPGGQTGCDQMLFCLAEFETEGVAPVDGLEPARARDRVGQICVLTWRADAPANRLLYDRLGGYAVLLVTGGEEGDLPPDGFRTLQVEALRGGEGDA